MNQTRAFWVTAPGTGELRPATVRDPGPGELRVRTLFSGISRGTESLVFQGRVPESQWDQMRAPFQAGEFPGPVRYGYQNVGRVDAVGEGVEPRLWGRAVFCLFPHQEAYVVPAGAVIPLPQGLPPSRAVLAANMETAVNAVWDAGPSVGDRIVVIGAGVVGLLIARLCRRIPGTRVHLVDPAPERREVAERLGLPLVTSTKRLPGSVRDADLVIHASGNPSGLEGALDLLGPEGTLVEVSWFGDRPVSLPLGGNFHSRRLTIRSSQVGRLSPDRTPRWDHGRRMELALRLLAGDPDLDGLISGESPFRDLPTVMSRIAGGEDPGVLCHRIRYEANEGVVAP
ncbi:MAG: dehydrogenase [Gemmatimonadales bacterium]|nr:MAG: dehydrogenase [Gemmatimonadales bacterium]